MRLPEVFQGSVHFHSKTIFNVINFKMERNWRSILKMAVSYLIKCTQSFMIQLISPTQE
jgi:hypothetical protein